MKIVFIDDSQNEKVNSKAMYNAYMAKRDNQKFLCKEVPRTPDNNNMINTGTIRNVNQRNVNNRVDAENRNRHTSTRQSGYLRNYGRKPISHGIT